MRYALTAHKKGGLKLGKNPHAVALGSLGGKVRGRKGAATLTEEERKAFAKLGAQARWAKKNVDSGLRLPHTETVHKSKRER
jgi:hypothetical protein